MASNFFHFTLGPVQGFVAQARRTRDFWAGSFLLSWLSGVAMAEVERQCGQGSIRFPAPPAGYLNWITGAVDQGEGPRQGAIPNRFKAQVNDAFQPALVEQAVRSAWVALAEHVWEQDGLGEVAASQTRVIWERQHGGFWEISWALTSDDSASNLLDRRKNWRSNHADPEPGVKCMVMDGWQELSGVPTPNRSDIEGFWKKLRERRAMQHDLLEGEHLCALAYVKRRFVRYFAGLSATLPTGLTVRGWKLEAGMPSVSYMAAVHWLEQLVSLADRDELQALADAARAVNPGRDEWSTRIACLVKCWDDRNDEKLKRNLLSLDGNLFFDHVHDNPAAYGYDARALDQLRNEIRAIRRNHDFTEPLSPFYAILLMDGDSLGRHMSEPQKQQPIAASLEKFTSGVRQLVEGHNGFLVYAGGDDVLAILPLEDAAGCAAGIRQSYLDCFAGTGIDTTISAAIEFAHVKMPLGKVLGDAHDLLDRVAKDGTGRDALAVRVWKPGGMALEWAQPWAVALAETGGQAAMEGSGRLVIQWLADAFRRDLPGEHGGAMSSKFFYRIRERFDFLAAGSGDAVLQRDECVNLLAVDYVNSADNRKQVGLKQAKTEIEPLLSQCTPHRRTTGQQTKDEPHGRLKVDGALLVRFLAQKGVDA
jgi:CRISPR-associated protein Cmr2